jgi:hypothetical protein
MSEFIRVRSAEGPAATYFIHPDTLASDPDSYVVVDDNGTEVEPPRGGDGSGIDAWRAYAIAKGLEVPEDAKREDIIALVDGQ